MKFATKDAAYKKRRTELSEKYGPRELWSVMDHWPLYCGVRNMARYLAIYEIFKTTIAVPGHVAEFGTWRGANLMFLGKMLRIFECHSTKMLHCFDSFEGLTEFHDKDGRAIETKGAYKGSLEELKDFMDLYEMNDEIAIHKGLIEDTLPKLLSEESSLSFSFVYCDVDLYQGTKTILENLHPRLSAGGVFVLDEWNDPENPGETTAVREFLEKYGDMYVMENITTVTQPSLVLRKKTMQSHVSPA